MTAALTQRTRCTGRDACGSVIVEDGVLQVRVRRLSKGYISVLVRSGRGSDPPPRFSRQKHAPLLKGSFADDDHQRFLRKTERLNHFFETDRAKFLKTSAKTSSKKLRHLNAKIDFKQWQRALLMCTDTIQAAIHNLDQVAIKIVPRHR